jgi:hypothetical protein
MEKIPVFIIGINPRSGTNYLFNILTLHPDCDAAKHQGEDYILSGADKYLAFCEKVTSRWLPRWENDSAEFKRCLESGIRKYLEPNESTARYIVSKTPNPDHADLFLKMFSSGYMILIIRRGQDLVESQIRSFGSSFEYAVKSWTRGAKWISKVIHDSEIMNSGRVLCIKYEDLYQKNEEVMCRLLDFLKLDKSRYDFQKSNNFDVIGSSTSKEKFGEVTWKPIPKEESFNPLSRCKSWNHFQHYRFNWLAGKFSKEFGYELYYESKGVVYLFFNLFITVYYFIFRAIRKVFRYFLP